MKTTKNLKMIKSIASIFILVTALFSGLTNVRAQCAYGGSQSPCGATPDASTFTPGTQVTVCPQVWGGEHTEVTNMQSGSTYLVESCGSPQPTQVTIFADGGGPSVGFGNSGCGDDASFNFSPPSTGTYEFQINHNACGTSATSNFIYVTLLAPAANTWDGSTSTDWNVGSNWSSGSVPSSSDNVVIPSAPSNQPHVTLAAGTPGVCADLTVESGAILTVDAGKALTVSGATANAGTITVKASASGIGSLITNGAVSGGGTYNMEQYLTGSGGATPNGLFWYVSSPVASATSNVFNAAGSDKLWSAVEATTSYPEITNNSTALNVGQGFVVRLGATGTKTFTGGAFNTGNVTEGSLTRTGTTEQNRGYNLVGNPYPSTVSWDDLSRTNLETTMYYRTHNGSTMLFDTYNATGMVGTNNNGDGAVTGDIPPTQAFWVRVPTDGQTGSLTFENADRSHGTATSIYRLAAEEGSLRINLSDGNVWDEQIILFNPSATDGYDDYDSQKYWVSDVPQLYTHVNEDTLTINGLNSPLTNSEVPLGIKVPSQGDYTINASSITLTETPIYLEDTYLNIFQNMVITPVYPFNSNEGNFGDRFILHFSQLTSISELKKETVVYTQDNILHVNFSEPKSGTISLIDMNGRIVVVEGINSNRSEISLSIASGIYLVKIETEDNTTTRKVAIQ